jgi:hypothetical protein
MTSQRESAHKIASIPIEEDSFYYLVRWLPSSQGVAYMKVQPARGKVTVETISVNGGSPSVLVSDAFAWEDFWWLPDGRVLYIADEPGGNPFDCNLWEARASARTGEPLSKPRKLSDDVGFGMSNLSVSLDGKKATYLGVSPHGSISIGRLQAGGLLGVPPHLTSGTRRVFPWS